MPEPEFRQLVDRSEALATLPAPDYPPSEFDLLVIEAIDNLPPEFQRLLADTPVVISNLGHEHRAYGMYMGGTVARDIYPDRIVIYQDTLERDFGHDPDAAAGAGRADGAARAGPPPGLGRVRRARPRALSPRHRCSTPIPEGAECSDCGAGRCPGRSGTSGPGGGRMTPAPKAARTRSSGSSACM